MSNKLYEENSVQAIANAIREANGKTDKYKIAEMPQAIKNLPTLSEAQGTTLKYNAIEYPVQGEYKGNVSQDGTPTPDTPVEVKTLKGWNLLNVLNSEIKTTNGLTYWVEDGIIHLDGTPSQYTTIWLAINDMLLNKDTTYTHFEDNIKIGGTININLHDNIGSWNAPQMNVNIGATNKTSYTFDEDTTYKYLVIATSQSFDDFKIKPMICKSTQSLPYLPYQSIGVKRTGSQLLDDSLMVEFTSNSSGWYSLDGISDFYSNSNIPKSKVYYDFKAGETYTCKVISQKNRGSTQLQLVDENGGVKGGNNGSSFTFTSTIDQRLWPRFVTASANVASQVVLFVYKGTEEVPYEPYQEQISYISLGDNEVLTTDEIKVKNGKVSLVKNWGKVVLDGSEDWIDYQNTATGIYKAYTTDVKIGKTNEFEQSAYSNYFKPLISLSQASSYIGLGITKNASYIVINNDIADNTTTLKTWLSTHNVTVYYRLETTQRIDLCYTDLQSIDGENNVEILATLEPTSMKEQFIKGE